MSRRKPLAALAAATTALALAVPTAGASAATTPSGHALPPGPVVRFVPGSLPCQVLISNIRTALLFHNSTLANYFSNVFVYGGCGGAAI
jgi:hypothetical protein